MRALGVDMGKRRVGLALSDASGTLARPWETRAVERASDVLPLLIELVRQLRIEEDGLDTVVIGLPLRLDGSPTDLTEATRTIASALHSATGITIVLQDERLTSHEAESRLALREKDWRVRKKQLDAAAAAIILQDYLDSRAPRVRDEGQPTDV